MIVDLRNRLAICRVATLQEAMGIADGLAAHNTTGALRELIRREARTIKRDA